MENNIEDIEIETNLDSERYLQESILSEETLKETVNEAINNKKIERQILENGFKKIKLYFDEKYYLCSKDEAKYVRIEIYDGENLVEKTFDEIDKVNIENKM